MSISYFDPGLGTNGYPIWQFGSEWINFTGAPVTPDILQYLDLGLFDPILGIPIWVSGSVFVDASGEVVASLSQTPSLDIGQGSTAPVDPALYGQFLYVAAFGTFPVWFTPFGWVNATGAFVVLPPSPFPPPTIAASLFPQIRALLDDRPPSFKPPGAPYMQVVDAIAWALTLDAEGISGIMASLYIGASSYGWLDVLGLLFGIPRNPNESDVVYEPRIIATLLAWVGTVPAIEIWAQITLGVTVTVTENFTYLGGAFSGPPGYTIFLPGTLSTVQLQNFVNSLARIRPAGVPFTLNVRTGGLYLGTINYLGEPLVEGSFLTSDAAPSSVVIPWLTTSAVPLLPTTYQIDPTINPGL